MSSHLHSCPYAKSSHAFGIDPYKCSADDLKVGVADSFLIDHLVGLVIIIGFLLFYCFYYLNSS